VALAVTSVVLVGSSVQVVRVVTQPITAAVKRPETIWNEPAELVLKRHAVNVIDTIAVSVKLNHPVSVKRATCPENAVSKVWRLRGSRICG
jgi:hypothetical protein